MKCPNCGAELQSEAYRKLRPGHYAPQICYYCPNGDFGTDYTHLTKAIAEIESAQRWNAQREATPWGAKDQREYEAAVEMAEHCERYEPTYNVDDGSM